MSQAYGVHEHPTMKLGLRMSDPLANVLTLKWAAGVVPDYPEQADHFPGWQIGMYGNDKYGVCGPTSLANYLRMISKYISGVEFEPPQDAVFDLYKRSGNPNFPRDDNGVDMGVMLAAALKGGLGSEEFIGYARLQDNSDPSVMAAINIFRGVLFGVMLQQAQQRQTVQTVWDYQPSAQWGGHAVIAGQYNASSGQVGVGTWAQKVETTANFRKRQLSEVWIPLSKRLITSQRFADAGVDVQALAADYQTLTGRPFPAAIPTPSPTPPPIPKKGIPLTIYPDTMEIGAPAGWKLRAA